VPAVVCMCRAFGKGLLWCARVEHVGRKCNEVHLRACGQRMLRDACLEHEGSNCYDVNE